MKAIVINHYGGVDQFQAADLPLPEPADNEVLVKTKATSVNPIDWKVRQGHLTQGATRSFPLVLGWDLSGVITAVGTEVTDFQVGDEILARPDGPDLQGDGTHGTYADYVLVKADKLVKKPATLSFNQAAALPLAGLTAWQVIVGQMNLQPGEKILVQAGAGGVGLFAIQIAHHLGAYVATTASPANHDLLKSLGADEVIDYHQGPIIDFLHDYDAVFDTINQIPAGMAILKPTGRLVSIVAAPTEADQAISPARASFWRLKSNGQDLQKLTDLVEEGAIKIVIDSVFPLTVEGVRQAQTKSEDGHTHGKIVLAAEE